MFERDNRLGLPTAAAVGAVLFMLYTAVAGFSGLPLYQWVLTIVLVIATAVVVTFIERSPAGRDQRRFGLFTIAFYTLTAFILFHPTGGNIFRSDYWLILGVFDSIDSGSSLPGALRQVSMFEIFGDTRFQPAAHLMMYLRHLLFGTAVHWFHITNILAHAACGVLVFALIRKLTNKPGLAFILGLVFIALQSQFDTVAWTYHIYIIIGTASVLASLYLACRYNESGSTTHLAGAIILALFALLLYEPAFFAPGAVVAAVLAPVLGGATLTTRSRLKRAALFGVGAYAIYGCVTILGLYLTSSEHVTETGTILSIGNIAKAAWAVCVNLWQTTFLKNTGLQAAVTIRDVVYVELPETILGSARALLGIAVSVLLIFFLRLPQRVHTMLLLFILLALSYIFIISLGRVYSNTIHYIVTQPRYQYFANAALIVALGLLLWEGFSRRKTRGAVTALLLALLLCHSQNTLVANNIVDEEMEFIDRPYHEIKSFTDENPEAIVYHDYYPYSNTHFLLGADIALDVMLGERITKLRSRATHVFDGTKFWKNPSFATDPGALLPDSFTLTWLYKRYLSSEKWIETGIVGGAEVHPSVSITNSGLVKTTLIDAVSGKPVTFNLKSPYDTTTTPPFKEWSMISLVKDGPALCLFFNGVRTDIVRLESKYLNWNGDGRELFGDFYMGKGGPVYLFNLLIEADSATLGCSKDGKKFTGQKSNR